MVGGMRVSGGNHPKSATQKEVATKENIENIISENILKDGTIVNAQPMKVLQLFFNFFN